MNQISVVITGMGMVSPLGVGVARNWSALLSGQRAFSPVTLFDTSGCRCHQAGQVDLPEDRCGFRSRATALAWLALEEALIQAGTLDPSGRLRRTETPWCVSTTGGAMNLGERFFRESLEGRPGAFRALVGYQPQQQIREMQKRLGATAPASIVANACASGGNALGQAADWIRAGLTDSVIAGGYEALAELIYTGFDCLQATSTTGIRPFDRNRDGLLLGEGAAFFVLEAAQAAAARGMEPLAIFTGYGHSTDLTHLTRPHPEGESLARAMRQAMREAGDERAASIGYVNAHGTATPANDEAEAISLCTGLGDRLDWKASSTKSAIGHTLGAAGSIEAAFAIQALRTGDLPPQTGTEHPLPQMKGRLPKPGDRLQPGQSVASVNLGFGGSNACLVFSPWDNTNRSSRAEKQHGSQGTDYAVALTVAGWGEMAPDRGKEDELPLISDASTRLRCRMVAADHPDMIPWKRHPRLRRSTPLARFLVAACARAFEAGKSQIPGLDASRIGLIVAEGTGSIHASAKFYRQVVVEGQAMASPALFPETVYNSPVSHVANALGISGPVDSLVGDESAWLTALLHAHTWLASDKVDAVVVAAGEELDPVAVEAYFRAGWFRNPDFIPSEGAGALLVTRPDQLQDKDAPAISGISVRPNRRHLRRPVHADGFAFSCTVALESVRWAGKAMSGEQPVEGSNFQSGSIRWR